MNQKKPDMIVPPEVFKTYSDSAKLDTMFYYVHAIYGNQEIQADEIEKLKKRKWFDKGLMVSAGGIGGFAVMALKWLLSLFTGVI